MRGEPVDVWARQAGTVMPEALEEGFRNFTWHIGAAMARKVDPIARLRAYALPFSQDCKIMLIDFPGAPEYDLFSSYSKPLAVYPTWTLEDGWPMLERLLKHPVGDEPTYYLNKSIQVEHRPVKGQKHRVVVHRTPGPYHQDTVFKLGEMQEKYPEAEIFFSGGSNINYLLDYGLKAADFRPICMVEAQIYARITLPSGKIVKGLEEVLDTRYGDWFKLIGITQAELRDNVTGDRRLWPRFEFRAIQWARHNWHLVEPFVSDQRSRNWQKVLTKEFIESPSAGFILPGTRQRVMRRLRKRGIELGEIDKFACDTCILQNTCKLYRKGSVCTVKGAETVSLAESFGTRNARRIIEGLDALLKRQVERLEDQMAGDDGSDPKVSAEVTRQINSVMSNGIKLAKLLDPTLQGSKVQVNVGINAGTAQVAVAQADPRQLMSQVVAELEAAGVKREDITADMMAGFLKTMGAVPGDNPTLKAIAATAATSGTPRGRKKVAAPADPASMPEDYSPEEILDGVEDLEVVEAEIHD